MIFVKRFKTTVSLQFGLVELVHTTIGSVNNCLALSSLRVEVNTGYRRTLLFEHLNLTSDDELVSEEFRKKQEAKMSSEGYDGYIEVFGNFMLEKCLVNLGPRVMILGKIIPSIMRQSKRDAPVAPSPKAQTTVLQLLQFNVDTVLHLFAFVHNIDVQAKSHNLMASLHAENQQMSFLSYLSAARYSAQGLDDVTSASQNCQMRQHL